MEQNQVARNRVRGVSHLRREGLVSIVVVVYNMGREAPRTLYSLCRKYQRDIAHLDYEVLVVDNGSKEPLGEELVRSFGANFRYFYIESAPPSPAYAINFGARHAHGDYLGIIIDGAHMLTPGVLQKFELATRKFKNPVVATRRFYLGPGQQSDTMLEGYNQGVEDRLLEDVNWMDDGYRLFDIGVFVGRVRPGWRSRISESNCFFLRTRLFQSLGGANESFDAPGGGFLNLDILKECLKVKDTQLVLIDGEASFHQIHGGITTNTQPAELEQTMAEYYHQYSLIRGEGYVRPDVPIEYVG